MHRRPLTSWLRSRLVSKARVHVNLNRTSETSSAVFIAVANYDPVLLAAITQDPTQRDARLRPRTFRRVALLWHSRFNWRIHTVAISLRALSTQVRYVQLHNENVFDKEKYVLLSSDVIWFIIWNTLFKM